MRGRIMFADASLAYRNWNCLTTGNLAQGAPGMGTRFFHVRRTLQAKAKKGQTIVVLNRKFRHADGNTILDSS